MPCLQMDLPATQDVPAHLSKVLKTMKVPLSALQPTNDLDLATVESMETFLAGYGGCLLVASHDRAFMEGLDRLFVLRGDGVVRLFEGLYSEVATLTPPPPRLVGHQMPYTVCRPSVPAAVRTLSPAISRAAPVTATWHISA